MNKSRLLNKKIKHNQGNKITNDATQPSSAQERDVFFEPLLNPSIDLNVGHKDVLETIQSRVILVPNTKISNQMKNVMSGLLNGATVLIIDGNNSTLITESQQK